MASNIGELRNDPRNMFNIIDLFKLLVPYGKTKYVELINKLTMELIDYKVSCDDDVVNNLRDDYGIDPNKVVEFSGLQVHLMKCMLDYFYSKEDISNFKKFCEFNEKGLIPKNDLTSYINFDQIEFQVNEAEDKEKQKKLESQILRIFEDEEWLILKPLTYQSSIKYGSHTKWCTSSRDSNEYFLSYSTKGILIYTINKKTDLKVAVFKSITDNQLTFWNQIDMRVDSSETELPHKIIELLRDETKFNLITNQSLFTPQVDVSYDTPIPWREELNEIDNHHRMIITPDGSFEELMNQIIDNPPNFNIDELINQYIGRSPHHRL